MTHMVIQPANLHLVPQAFLLVIFTTVVRMGGLLITALVELGGLMHDLAFLRMLSVRMLNTQFATHHFLLLMFPLVRH